MKFGINSLAKITIAVAVVTGLAVSAQAKKVTSKRSAVKGLRVAAVNPVQTETTSVSEVAAAPAKKWSITAFADSFANAKSFNGSQGGLSTSSEIDSGVIAGYKVDDKTSASVAMEFMTLTGGNDVTTTTLLDPSFRLSRSNVLANDAGVDVSLQGRLYLPFGQISQEAEQIAQVRVYATASKDLAKGLNLKYTLNPRFFIQQNETYGYTQDDKEIIPVGAATPKFRLINAVALKYSFNDVVALEQEVGMYQKWVNNGGARRDQLQAGTSVYVTPASWLELQAGVRQMDDGASDTRKSMRPYSDESTEYFLTTTVSM